MLLRFSRPFKYLVYSSLILILAYTGAYAALYRASEPAAIHHAGQAFFAPYGRSFSFDREAVGRRLLPRPTLILKNVSVSRLGGSEAALSAEEVRIGMAWSGIFSVPEVEKLVIQQPRLSVRRLPEGGWDFADLLRQEQGGALRINRIQTDGGMLDIDGGAFALRLHRLRLNSHIIGGTRHYTLSGQAGENVGDSLEFTAAGRIESGANRLDFPDLHTDFAGSENGHRFTGSLKTRLSWQPRQLELDELRFQLQSNRHETALSGGAAKISAGPERARISRLSIVADMRPRQTALHHTVEAADTVWEHGALTVDNLSWDGHLRGGGAAVPLAAKLTARLYWQPGGTLQLSPLKLTTLPQGAEGAFASEWEGGLSRSGSGLWQLSLQGLYQRQPARLQLQQQKSRLSGSLDIAKLDLAGYTAAASGRPLSFPALPTGFSTDIAIRIGTLAPSPEWEIHNIDTRLRADAQGLRLQPLSAELYSGSGSGSLTVENTVPPTLHLKQQFKNVQLRPLLERLVGTSRVAGIGEADLDLRARGTNRKELTETLSGRMNFHIGNGEWLGINFYTLLKHLFAYETPAEPESPNTPFSRFTYTSNIKNGISAHSIEAELLQPQVRISSEGTGNFNTQTLNSRMLITGTGSEIPLRLQGTFDAPEISLDYPQITSGLSTPEEKQKALGETLKKQWDWLKTR